LPFGNYEYYVKTHCTNTCVSIFSNSVEETIETCAAVTDLASEQPTETSVLLTWSPPQEDAELEGYTVYRNETLLTEEFILDTFYLDESLPVGNYEYYILTYYLNGCVSNLSNHVEETITVGIKEVGSLESIVLYPNPTTGELIINNEQLIINNVELFDVYGRNLLSHTANRAPQTAINIAHLQAGVYFVKVTTEAGAVMRKVVKQ